MRRSPSVLSLRRRLLIAGVATTLLSFGLATATASAASAAGNTTAAGNMTAAGSTSAGGKAGVSTGKASPSKKENVTALCPPAKPGYASCFALRRTDITAHKGIQPAVTPGGYGPADLASAYAIPANGGGGQTVAIVDAFDDPNAEADLTTYRSQYGLPPCTTGNGCFRKSDQRGGTSYPSPDPDWSGEISLDLDMVSAIAPDAHILLIETDDNDIANLSAGVDEAVALGAKYVSNSYGSDYDSTPGSGEDPSEVTDLDPHYDHPGVAVVASSGDGDYGVSYPAASQYVTAVGGTSLVPDSSTRGWSESVWNNSYGGPGSGCSVYEPKPAWQTDAGCSMRSEADVSAVADPDTGVAVYDTYQNGGWGIFGGTSASSPIIAAVFADAGTPTPGTYPSSYPYIEGTGINDVTEGSNGSCTPAYYCTAGAGYDGPTGLGTPNGLTAFTTVPFGSVAGTVTDALTGDPISGARVSVGDAHATTDATGAYSVTVPVGTYDVTASKLGWGSSTTPGVVVTDGATTTADFALSALASATISGTVTDGSGHGWPLYATIAVDGLPVAPVYTDPYTGQYSITLPAGSTYQLDVSANYTGYQAVTKSVTIAAGDVTADISVPVDVASCDAPGYVGGYTGTTEPFDATSAPAGWSVDNGTGVGGWEFDDPNGRGNLTGGSGGFAIVDSDFLGIGNSQDTYLTSPVTDFTGVAAPDVSFDSDYRALSSTADVDVSIDNGATWTNVWDRATDQRGPVHVDVPMPSAANQSQVRVRFHYTGSWAWWWEIDNVFLGERTCAPVTGGLVAGVVTDANTHSGLVGATVTSVSAPDETATTAATGDPAVGDGFYWMFSSLTGKHTFTAAKSKYVTKSKAVNVRKNKVTKANYNLAAGQITIKPASIAKTVDWGGTASQTVTVRNTGGAPATVQLGERAGGTVLLTAGGAPLTRISGKFSPHSLHGVVSTGTAKPDATPSAAPWTTIANYPVTIQDNGAAVVDGKVYSAFGYDGTTDESSLYVYDPDAGTWSALASAADTRERPAMAGIDGKIYASGGWGADGDPDGTTEIYDPASDSWSTGATNPDPYSASGTAVLDGKMYVVGGCTASVCGSTDVMVYDPATDSWSAAAPYLEPVAWESCGAISGKLYCAGGTTDAATITHTYVYDPDANTWSPQADLPADLWASGYVAAEGQLLVSGGVAANSSVITNQGYAFDPTSDTWSPLPNSNNTLYRGASACGFYKVGGSPGGLGVPPVTSAEVLPGYVDCANAADVSWMSATPTTLTLAPHSSATVAVTLNANVPDITQPGTYNALITVGTDTPYSVSALPVALTVNPPPTWGKITGTVTGPSGPIAGATVQINGASAHFTLKTDASGHYQLWLDVANNPLQVICAKDGFQPQVAKARIKKGKTTTLDFALLKD